MGAAGRASKSEVLEICMRIAYLDVGDCRVIAARPWGSPTKWACIAQALLFADGLGNAVCKSDWHGGSQSVFLPRRLGRRTTQHSSTSRKNRGVRSRLPWAASPSSMGHGVGTERHRQAIRKAIG